ncbi:MAG: hypothetical protein BWY77_00654 [bacterium ADurb.Bin431]|nr:MAG: hypothetical protein BWY77_00654 [bacterium ADurb.Bin431]
MHRSMWLLIMFISLALLRCTVRAPELNVTGEKTALENQVLGAYQQIESDSWLIASARAVGATSSAVVSGSKKEVIDAVQNRKFNKDEVDELKADKVVGENNRGLLQPLAHPRYDGDPEYRLYVDQIIEEENNDRLIIYERVLTINQTSAEAARANEVFAKLNFDNSAPGTMIQNPDGTWVEKPAIRGK